MSTGLQLSMHKGKSVFGQRPMVQISDGKIRGIYDFAYYGRQFAGFIGIPYAEPPLGQLRFKEPVPVKPWQGIWDASRLKINCLQLDDDRQKVVGEEDCLYLNVFTSQLPSVNSIHPKLDVVIFFHPGAFMFGGGDWYGPHYIMDRNVVLVTVNYRLNVLGFLSTLDEVLPGNNGLKDQVLALKWVKKNIAAFGGNPDSVTIAGTSAGASSVQYHFLSPLSKGLFVRGISTSGTTLCAWANAERMREKAFRLGAAVGCDTDSSTMLIRCLRNRPAGQLVEKVLLFQPWNFNPFSPFAPVTEKPHEGAFITEDPLQALIGGKLRNLPWLTGVTTSEGLYPAARFLNDEEQLHELDTKFNEIAPLIMHYNYTIKLNDLPKVNKMIRSFYLGSKTISKNTTTEVTQMIGDRLFQVPAARAVELQAHKNKSPVYLYKFNYRGTYSLSDRLSHTYINFGVAHADDVGYILNTSYIPRFENQEEKDMSNFLLDMWINFMRNGNPNSEEHNFGWTPTSSTGAQIDLLEINSPTNYNMTEDSDLGHLNFWNKIPDQRAKYFHSPS
ncbi:esterase FE4-like [Schistocerca cancellata]|uniref:esterase FE4-like n=1 Tax=Schistocerca cancellata TaxID=274614 RepID=UPI002118E4B9|nr:esterase FE4-like [Schistocerca cancellata]